MPCRRGRRTISAFCTMPSKASGRLHQLPVPMCRRPAPDLGVIEAPQELLLGQIPAPAEVASHSGAVEAHRRALEQVSDVLGFIEPAKAIALQFRQKPILVGDVALIEIHFALDGYLR